MENRPHQHWNAQNGKGFTKLNKVPEGRWDVEVKNGIVADAIPLEIFNLYCFLEKGPSTRKL